VLRPAGPTHELLAQRVVSHRPVAERHEEDFGVSPIAFPTYAASGSACCPLWARLRRDGGPIDAGDEHAAGVDLDQRDG
jgi:hypothetical protein